jgi:lysyl-tRNA synthetase class 2
MTSAWWSPDRHADRKPFLAARGKVKAAAYDYFAREGFTEVECGALQVSPGNEAHLHAFETEFVGEGGSGSERLYLHTSPEFACKKLLAAGERKIFDFARVYRNRESGPLHSPEFTMLEWYRAGEPYGAVMNDTVELCRLALKATGRKLLEWKGNTCDPTLEPARVTVAGLFANLGVDLDAATDDRDAMAAVARKLKVQVGADDNWSDIFSKVLVQRIEPMLGFGRLTILSEYPRSEAALARPLPHDDRFAERFELYACGVELANGFGELTDVHEQRRRFEAEMDVKQATYGERYPLDEDFLSALAHMPEASGVALGFDRLVMLSAGARRIEDVLWTPPVR